jgi:alpha-D-ribose 1-methylphosphonate 5-triphosphate synthase subunit PhnI
MQVAQIREQMKLATARVMNEGSLYDEDLAALALKQSQGDAVEAAFLMRAYRTTLPRFGSSEPVDTASMAIRRRISAAFKDLPGGQVLGPTYDYTHRLFDFTLEAEGATPMPREADGTLAQHMPRVTDILGDEGLMESEAPPFGDPAPVDVTRDPAEFPSGRDARLQLLSRGDEGFLLGLAYSVQRGFGGNHPFAGEIRMGEVSVMFTPKELGFEIDIGDITLTECQMINQFQGSSEVPPQFTRGYGLAFGQSERKAMSMAIVDRALKTRDFGEACAYPAQQEEFVLYHCDTIEASGFVEHLKLPHYVDFQGELELIRKIRREQDERRKQPQKVEVEA